MARTDPEARWVYQTWIWRGFSESQLPYLRGFLAGVPAGRLILLDQTAEREPLWSKFNNYSFFNTSFVWCAMHEMVQDRRRRRRKRRKKKEEKKKRKRKKNLKEKMKEIKRKNA